MRYAEDVYDNAMMSLRLGDRPRLIVTTTPRPTAFMKKLVKMEGVSITTARLSPTRTSPPTSSGEFANNTKAPDAACR
jgi:phage terminase large subunit-like protein